MALTALAMILIMSPASYHRLAGHEVLARLVLIRKSNRKEVSMQVQEFCR